MSLTLELELNADKFLGADVVTLKQLVLSTILACYKQSAVGLFSRSNLTERMSSLKSGECLLILLWWATQFGSAV